MIIECAVENFAEAMQAQTKGANSIELCENLTKGGVTPSYGSIKQCIDKLNIPVSVLIRPRSGNFVYNEDEINIMLEDIGICNILRPNFIVIGALTNNNKIDYNIMEILINASKIPVIMNRAFDEVNLSYLEVAKLAKIGVSGILSAGGKSNFFDGIVNLKKTHIECIKHNINLIAAGQITSQQLAKAQSLLSPYAFHGKDIL